MDYDVGVEGKGSHWWQLRLGGELTAVGQEARIPPEPKSEELWHWEGGENDELR